MATKEIPMEVDAPRTNHLEHIAQHEQGVYDVGDNAASAASEKGAIGSLAAGGVDDDYKFTFNKMMAMLVSQTMIGCSAKFFTQTSFLIRVRPSRWDTSPINSSLL